MKSQKNIYVYFLLIIGVIILINILSDKFFVRLDFTEDNRYTLSKATKDIIKSLDEPITVKAYFSEDVPPDVAKTKRDFKELLVEFASVSGGKVVYEFINPNADEQLEQQAMQAGIQPVIINSREKDQSVQKKAYLGAVIQKGEQSDIIPFMQPGAAMEYALSSSIKKLSVSEKPVIGLLQGHGEPTINSMQQVMSSLNILYQVEPVTLSDTVNLLDKFNTVVIVAPKDSFPQSHLNQLDKYLTDGKNLFMAINKVDGDFSTSMGNVVNTGLEGWLKNKGITIENNFVVDANCASVQVRQQQGGFSFATNVNFPYLPIISDFAEHPATKGLEAVILQFASSITFNGDTSIKFVALAKSSKKSGTASAPLYFNIQKQWTENDFPLSGIPVAALFEGKLSGNNSSKLILVSDGNFPVNGEGQQAQQLQGDNVNLMVNAIDWLSDDTGLIELRTKGVSSRPLDQIEDGTKATLKWLNFLLPILLIVVYGIFRMQMKRRIKIKRMEEGYV
ncbi:MAG: hypothetical protein A2046_16120 [Bacteroidetes bacterium GWA2_30_7]|nr:MAG: hypothetical protein A2046_16120 [Bacteroidetes bacterium GWA2_30_7]